ncbi:hypothetical protein G7068_08295 [Leucobacter viscericola]|uniref:Uncharacterized protein n=1 Tax=Leucobacter viscericola TaxID=2714935 RepID=A0A6G7XF56_9MICO|nr:hypothetical protein [Leucobacter viscericola]QIK63195.1 hypothetical protein G7068_08295 [Leucobacter viscericola]
MTDLNSGSITHRGASLHFGGDAPYVLTSFVRGVPGLRATDVPAPNRNGTILGRAFRDGPLHQLKIAVLGGGTSQSEKEASVRSRLRELESFWDGDTECGDIEDIAELRIGEVRAFGHMREFTPDDSTLWDGSAEPSLTFQTVDKRWYGDPTVTRINMVPPVSGGLEFPAEAPFTFDSGPMVRSKSIRVTGEAAAWPVFAVHGPITNPIIDVPGVGKLILNGILASDQVVVLDTRPWARWVLKDGNGAPGMLSPAGSRMSEMALPVGAHTVILRGYDTTGTAWLDVSVEPAYTSF